MSHHVNDFLAEMLFEEFLEEGLTEIEAAEAVEKFFEENGK